MTINTRKTIHDMLGKYDYLSRDGDEIEITEWANGEGWDVEILRDREPERFQLTRGTLDALNYLTNALDISKIENIKENSNGI